MNTDLFKPRHKYLYKKVKARLKLNEIRRMTKMGNFDNEGQIKVRVSFFEKMSEEVLVMKHFITVTKI